MAAAIYNVPTDIAALSNYNLGDAKTLFDVESSHTSQSIGVLDWTYVASGLAGTAGQAWTSGGYDYVQLDSNGGGVECGVDAQNPGDANGDGRVGIND